MKILQEEFKKNGFQFKQLRREGNLAIYKRWKEGGAALPHFEVIKIGFHDTYFLKNKDKPDEPIEIKAAETYPSSEQWGAAGFTFQSEEDALDKFRNWQDNIQETMNDTSAPRKRGRSKANFAFPSGEFKIKDLAQSLGISIPTVHLRIKEAGSKVKRLREEDNGCGRGAKVGIYVYKD